jgi:hypothetical protein
VALTAGFEQERLVGDVGPAGPRLAEIVEADPRVARVAAVLGRASSPAMTRLRLV